MYYARGYINANNGGFGYIAGNNVGNGLYARELAGPVALLNFGAIGGIGVIGAIWGLFNVFNGFGRPLTFFFLGGLTTTALTGAICGLFVYRGAFP